MVKSYLINQFGSSTTDIEKAFMIRYVILRTKWIKIFVHQFLRTDVGPYHSHPFSFISFLIKGSYVEQLYSPSGCYERPRKAFSVLFRDAFSFHKIRLTNNQPWTLCIAWAAGKNWHYLDETTGKQIKWRKHRMK